VNGNLERRVERLEQAAGTCGCDDPRVYSYPNTLAEAMTMAQMSDQQLKEYLRKRRNRPSAETCDRFDELFKQGANET
jgi:hypothetical protein